MGCCGSGEQKLLHNSNSNKFDICILGIIMFAVSSHPSLQPPHDTPPAKDKSAKLNINGL